VKLQNALPKAQPAGVTYDTGRRLSDAVLAGLGCLPIGLAFETWRRRGDSDLLACAAIGLGLTGSLLTLRVVARVSFEVLEKVTMRDWDGDGTIGGERGERPIIVNRKPLEQKMGVELWEAFVRAVVTDSSERALFRQGFTDAQIGLGRDALIYHGLATWRSDDRRHGWALLGDTSAEDVLGPLPYCALDGDDGA